MVDLDAVERYGNELVNERDGEDEKRNWILPNWELEKSIKSKKVLWRMVLWERANKRELKRKQCHLTISTAKTACEMHGLIEFP